MNIHIFGASGSGATTLGRFLAVQLNVPCFDSDDYFWKTCTKHILIFSLGQDSTIRGPWLDETDSDTKSGWPL